jgi:hypothetical protein
MQNKNLTGQDLATLKNRYQRLKEQLLDLAWISQGRIMPRPPRAWRLTRKVKGQSVTIALSAAQATVYRQALAENRKLDTLLQQMRALSEKALLGSAPGVTRRPSQNRPKRP